MNFSDLLRIKKKYIFEIFDFFWHFDVFRMFRNFFVIFFICLGFFLGLLRFFLDFFTFFWIFEIFGFLDFFLGGGLVFFKVTMVTTKTYCGYYWAPNIGKNNINLFFCPKGKQNLRFVKWKDIALSEWEIFF